MSNLREDRENQVIDSSLRPVPLPSLNNLSSEIPRILNWAEEVESEKMANNNDPNPVLDTDEEEFAAVIPSQDARVQQRQNDGNQANEERSDAPHKTLFNRLMPKGPNKNKRGGKSSDQRYNQNQPRDKYPNAATAGGPSWFSGSQSQAPQNIMQQPIRQVPQQIPQIQQPFYYQIPMMAPEQPQQGVVVQQYVEQGPPRVDLAMSSINTQGLEVPANNVGDPDRDIQRNRLDTEATRRLAFPGINLAANLVSKHTTATALTGVVDYGVACKILELVSYGRCYAIGNDTEYAMPYLVLEMVAPLITDERFRRVQEANAQIIEELFYFLKKKGATSPLFKFESGPEYEAYGHEEGAEKRLKDWVGGDRDGDFISFRNAICGNNNELTAATRLDLLNLLCNYIRIGSKTMKIQHCLKSVYALCYVALAKRGQISDEKLERIIESIDSESAGKTSFTAKAVKAVYDSMQSFVTENNAADVFAVLSRGMEGTSLRLQLTLDQAAGSGLTSYLMIIRAIKEFPDFPWDRIFQLYGTDVLNFRLALQEVGGNLFYGFKKDLGVVKSTKFKNLAYVAITLLKTHRAQEYDSLRNYKGVIKKPNKADQCEDLIMNYAPADTFGELPACSNEVFRTATDLNIG